MFLHCALAHSVFSIRGVHGSAASSAATKVICNSQRCLMTPPVAQHCDGSSRCLRWYPGIVMDPPRA